MTGAETNIVFDYDWILIGFSNLCSVSNVSLRKLIIASCLHKYSNTSVGGWVSMFSVVSLLSLAV